MIDHYSELKANKLVCLSSADVCPILVALNLFALEQANAEAADAQCSGFVAMLTDELIGSLRNKLL